MIYPTPQILCANIRKNSFFRYLFKSKKIIKY